MNTKQLVVLWFSGLATIVALIVDGLRGRPSLWQIILSIIILGGLFVYTMKPHPDADIRRVRKIVLSATGIVIILIILSIILIIAIDNRSKYRITTSSRSSMNWNYLQLAQSMQLAKQVELFDVNFTGRTGESGRLSGRIRNNSKRSISYIIISVSIYSNGTQIDGDDIRVRFWKGIPPNEVRSFNDERVHVTLTEDYSFNCQVIGAE